MCRPRLPKFAAGEPVLRQCCILATLLLASCGQLEAQRQAQQAEAMQAQAAADDAQCRAYGAAPGTPIYIQCRMNLDNQRAAAAETNRALVIEHLLAR